MPNVALIPRAETRIAPLVAVVDGFPDLTHKLETTTGGEPLEDGRAVTDHAVARQSRLVLTGMVGDLNGGDRPREAWETIRRLHKEVAVFTVITEWGTYQEMIIRRAEAPQRARGMRFTLELEQIIRVGVPASDLPESAVVGERAGSSLSGAGQAAQSTQRSAETVREAADQVADAAAGNPGLVETARAASAEASMAGDAARATNRLLGATNDPRLVDMPAVRTSATALSVAAQRAERAVLGLEQEVQAAGAPGDTMRFASRASTQGARLTRNADALLSEVNELSRQTIALNRTAEVSRGRIALPATA